MLQFSLEYQQAIDMLTGDQCHDLQMYELSEREWAIASQLADVLKVCMCHHSVDCSVITLCTGFEGCDSIFLPHDPQSCDGNPCHGLYRWLSLSSCQQLCSLSCYQSISWLGQKKPWTSITPSQTHLRSIVLQWCISCLHLSCMVSNNFFGQSFTLITSYHIFQVCQVGTGVDRHRRGTGMRWVWMVLQVAGHLPGLKHYWLYAGSWTALCCYLLS